MVWSKAEQGGFPRKLRAILAETRVGAFGSMFEVQSLRQDAGMAGTLNGRPG